MENEFSTTKFEWNSIELGPDGIMCVHGFPFPQGATITNSAFGEVTVNKESGEGKELTLTHPLGKIWAIYCAGRWRIRTDIQEVIQSAKHPASSTVQAPRQSPRVPEEDQFPYPIPGPLDASPSVASQIIRATPALLGIAAALLVCFFLYEEQISDFAAGFAAKNQKAAEVAKVRALESQRNQAYRELEKNVRQAHAEASRNLEELESGTRSLSGKFDSSIGTSFERIAISPDNTPREIDDAALRDASFLRAWNQMLNAYPTRPKREAMHSMLKNIEYRDQMRKLDETDKTKLEELARAVEDAREALRAQEPNIELVRTVIARERLRSRIDFSERRSP